MGEWVEWAVKEARVAAVLAVREVEFALARRAGVKKGHVLVFFTPDTAKPPTLQHVHPKALKRVGKGAKHTRTQRRIVVGKKWLIQQEPALWAALVGARLLDATFTIPMLKEE